MLPRFIAILGILALYLPANASPATPAPVKKITITVTGEGEIYMGRDTVLAENLSKELEQRLWKSYLGTGKMYDSIVVGFQDGVLMGMKGSVLDAVKEGQQKALEMLCVDKYHKPFDKLGAAQQQKVRKNFPVLFQELKW